MRSTEYVSATVRVVGFGLALLLAAPFFSIVAGRTQQNPATAPPVLTDQEKQLVGAFSRHVNDYLRQRQAAAKKVPKLGKDSTPEQIEAYQKAFLEAIRTMRAGTTQGYVFSPAMATYVRSLIKAEFPGREKVELRKTILEADTKGVPVRVNYPYPKTKELAQVPPTLLMKLPQLPKEVKYRFVGRNMLLVDTDNSLIIDYMVDALP